MNRLTVDQILQLFKNAEAYARGTGANKNIAGQIDALAAKGGQKLTKGTKGVARQISRLAGVAKQKMSNLRQGQLDLNSVDFDAMLAKKYAGLPLTESEQAVVNELGWDNIKRGVGRVATQVGSKITARDLGAMWQKAGKPTDTENVLRVLQVAGLNDEAVSAIAQASNVDISKVGQGQQAPVADIQKRGMVSKIGGAAAAALNMRTAQQKAADKQRKADQQHQAGVKALGIDSTQSNKSDNTTAPQQPVNQATPAPKQGSQPERDKLAQMKQTARQVARSR